jgi:hypothetical protein
VFRNLLRANVSEVAPIVVKAFVAAISAAFLIGALAVVAMDQPAAGGTQWSCAMPAKGGAPCLTPPSFDDQSNAGAVQHEGDCPSLGRAGRVCAE